MFLKWTMCTIMIAQPPMLYNNTVLFTGGNRVLSGDFILGGKHGKDSKYCRASRGICYIQASLSF